MAERQKPTVLCILDGWGYRKEKEYNAIELGNTPVWHRLFRDNPHSFLFTSGLAVGLPEGQMGNSEVGHTNIGAGRVVMQDFPKISLAIEDGSFATKSALIDFIAKMQATGGTCHLFGMISNGGVHSHEAQILGAVRILAANGIKVAVHAFLDGRDTPPDSALLYIRNFSRQIQNLPNVSIASIGGRFYGMDRDKRWERISMAYNAVVDGSAPRFASAEDAISASYKNKIFDEFVRPAVIGGYEGMKDNDGIFMANFRADRARQILTALLDPDFDGFRRNTVINFAAALGMVEYSTELNKLMTAVFPPEDLLNVFGEVVANAGLTQLRIAETEKYAHVTYFFNGGAEKVFAGEERILIPSPKVATYDLMPEMSAHQVTDKLIEAVNSDKFDVIIVNYANGDMVGHTGILQAAEKACEAVDTCLGRLEQAVLAKNGVLFIIADHGNAEMMYDEKNHSALTSHTTFEVPAVLVNAPEIVKGLTVGKLADVAPTLLDIMGIEKPKEMTGHSLLIF